METVRLKRAWLIWYGCEMQETSAPTDEILIAGYDHIGSRIVHAAATKFIMEGFEGASTANIAKQAKTSKREIYARFPTKEDLFESVMHYLCSLAEDEPAHAPEDGFAGQCKAAAMAVNVRFAQAQTRGVLIAAIAAKRQHPSIIEIFWSSGPGQAVQGVSQAIRDEFPEVTHPDAHAYQFILNACAPLVTRQLFDDAYDPDLAQIKNHVDQCYQQFLTDLKSAN